VELILPVPTHDQVEQRARATVDAGPPLTGRCRVGVGICHEVADSASGTFGMRLDAEPRGRAPGRGEASAGLRAALVPRGARECTRAREWDRLEATGLFVRPCAPNRLEAQFAGITG
jgi:hypothetical protein